MNAFHRTDDTEIMAIFTNRQRNSISPTENSIWMNNWTTFIGYVQNNYDEYAYIHFYHKNELKVKKEFIETVISSGAFSIRIYMTFPQFFSSSMYYMILQAFKLTYLK